MDCYFCKECGARVVHRIREADGTERATCVIKGGLVDGLNWKGPAKHIYARSAVVEIPEGAEKWDEMPPLSALTTTAAMTMATAKDEKAAN
jgi:hypothetical protein